MLNRNIKQSITALEIFTRLEDKLQTGECKIHDIRDCSVMPFLKIYKSIDICIYLLDNKHIEISLNLDDKSLHVTTYGVIFPKVYKQELTDEEFENVKNRFIKIAQKQQDNFEQWIKSPNVTFN